MELFSLTKQNTVLPPREYLPPNCQLSEEQTKNVELVEVLLKSLNNAAIVPHKRLFMQGKLSTGNAR